MARMGGGTSAGTCIASGHAWAKHGAEFSDLGITSARQLGSFADDVMARASGADVRALARGRTAYWDRNTGTVVIRDPRSVDGGTVFRPEETIAWLVASLHPDYYVDEDAARDAVKAGGTFNVVHVRAGIKIDFFVAGADAFERERLRKRVPIRPDSALRQTLWIDTAEHTILRKLEWYRRGGEVSERQWRDVLAIIAVQGETLDRDTLENWAQILGVSDLLARGFREY